MRGFFALRVPDEVARALTESARALKPIAERFEPRWTRSTDMHLTLKFLGDVPDEAITELSEITRRRAAEHPPVEAMLDCVSAFPDTRRARVLVALVKADLDSLAKTLDDDAAGFGVERERRPFRPHLTMARFQRPGNAAFVVESARLEPVPFLLSELVLFQSRRSPKGAEYVAVASEKLG